MPVKFGRYSDAFKPKSKNEKWNECDKMFSEKKYTDSYMAFFEYLKDSDEQNVFYTVAGNDIKFQLLQGSKEVRGFINENKITALSVLAEYEKLSVAAMRRLMEYNYTFYYSRFATKDNRIVLKLDSSVIDGSPRKLYFALRELAVRADRLDELLLDDFTSLKPLDIHREEYLPAELDVMYSFFTRNLNDVLSKISVYNKEQMSGGISYLLLNIVFRLYYFLSPEGSLLTDFEKIILDYFTKDNIQFMQKITNLETALVELAAKPKDKIVSSLYKTKSTFGVASPADPSAGIDSIGTNIGNIAWYIENSYPDIALSILEYIPGYCLYHFGLPKPLRDLFGLLMQALNSKFCKDTGSGASYFDAGTGSFNIENLTSEIKRINTEALEMYPSFLFKTETLLYTSLLDFAKSFLTEMQILKFNN